jgi:hypothetical protein
MMKSEEWVVSDLTVICQLSSVNYHLSTIICQLSTIICQPSTFFKNSLALILRAAV